MRSVAARRQRAVINTLRFELRGRRDRVREFLEHFVASGGHLWACRMSPDMNYLTKEDLYDEVEGIISAADFIEINEGVQLLLI
jgi:predicted peroxiredoxin